MIAFAHETLVLANPDEHIQIACRSSHLAGMSAAAQPDALAVGNAGRHLHVELAGGGEPSPAAAVVAGLLGHAAVAVADVAHHRSHHLAERRARGGLQLPRAAAALAGLDRGPRLGAVAVAVLAAVDRLIGDLHRLAVSRLDQIHFDRDGDVGARRRP